MREQKSQAGGLASSQTDEILRLFEAFCRWNCWYWRSHRVGEVLGDCRQTPQFPVRKEAGEELTRVQKPDFDLSPCSIKNNSLYALREERRIWWL